MATAEEAADGIRLKELLLKHKVDVMQATPGTWRMLLAADWEGGSEFKALVGGEAFPADLAASLAGCSG